MLRKKLSIIIPVYNGEKYIDKCIQSVFDQQKIDLEIIEIIAIDDGSKDTSLSILKTAAKKHPDLLHVISQKNTGAAATRNRGITLATGEYITFLDQDDWLESDFCKTLISLSELHGYDILQSGFRLSNSSGHAVKTVLPVETRFGRMLAIPAWAKLYRTAFLRDNDITFFENNIGEDSLFTVKASLCAEKYGTITYAGYNNFFENDTNVTNTLHKGLSKEVNFIRLLDELKGIKAPNDDQKKILEYNIIRTCAYYLLSYGKYATAERFTQSHHEIFAWLRVHIPHVHQNTYVWRKPVGEHVSASLGIRLIIILTQLHAIPLFAKLYCKRAPRVTKQETSI